MVVSPTFHSPRYRQGAGVPLPCSDCGYLRQQPNHILRSVPIAFCSVTQLSVVIIAPAFRPTCRCHRTGVAPPCRDLLDPGREPHHIDRPTPIGSSSISQLPLVIVSPPFHPASRGQDTGMSFTRFDLHRISKKMGWNADLCTGREDHQDEKNRTAHDPAALVYRRSPLRDMSISHDRSSFLVVSSVPVLSERGLVRLLLLLLSISK